MSVTRLRERKELSDFSNIEQNLPGDNGNVVPPESIPNSVVKRISADGSVGDPM